MSPIKEAIEAQPEALWLATKIEEVHRGHWCNTLEMNAATELRRQHAEIAQLTAALAALRSMPAEPPDPFAGHVEHETKQTPYGPATSYRRAPDAAVPMVPSHHETLTLNLYGATLHTAPLSDAEIERIADVNYQRGEEIGYRKGQASKRPLLSDEAMQTIGRWLNADMDLAVSNGADSRSMPDELVEIAGWLSDVPIERAVLGRGGEQ